MTHPLRTVLVLAVLLLVAIGSAGVAFADGTVTAELNNNGNTLTITGDDEDNDIEVDHIAGDLVITGLNSTAVIGSPVPLAGVTKIVFKLKKGGDYVNVLEIVSPDADLQFNMGRGEDALELDDTEVRSVNVNLSRGTDDINAGDITVTRKSKIDGSRGSDVFDLSGIIEGPVDVKGFERIAD